MTDTGPLAACESVTVKLSWLVPLLPSVIEASPMASVGTTAGGAVSSLTMVPTPVPSAMVALCGLLSTTLNCSLPSTSVSGVMAMLIVLLVSPGAKVTVPLMPVKSTLPAVPDTV